MVGGVHILVAEDEDLVAMALAEVLEAEGFRVTVTHNGQKAIDTDVLDPADLLVTDMRMPIIGGKALIETLRAKRPNLPVIVMTGYSEDLPNDEPGRLVVLRKPFSMSTLVRHAVAFLHCPQRPTQEITDKKKAAAKKARPLVLVREET